MNQNWINFTYDEPATTERRCWLRCEFVYIPGQNTVHHISANAFYTLYINGQWVSRGPARTNSSYRAYDTVDLAPHLRPGSNEARVLLYVPGIPTFIDPCDVPAGFWMSGALLQTGPQWQGARATGYLPVTTKCSYQLGLQEHFDSRRMGDEIYFPVDVFKSPLQLEPSGIPQLHAPLREPVAVLSGANGAAGGWESAADITACYCAEKRTWHKPQADDDALCYDFGSEVYGHVILDVPEHAAGAIDILAIESASGLTPDIIPPDKARAPICFGHRVILCGKAFRHELTMPMGFRYLVLIGRPAAIPGINIAVREQLYPLEIQGRFACSDKRLNDIWQASLQTQRHCMADAYMDCPWREQTQWWGDAKIQAQNTFRLSTDTRLFERGLRQIGRTSAVDGLTQAFAPARPGSDVIPGFSLVWVCSHYDHWFETGSLDLYHENRNRIDEVMEYFRRQTRTDGLQYRDPRFWQFIDWCPELFTDGASTVINLQYLEALRMVHILSGHDLYAQLARDLERAIDANLYDRQSGLLFDGIDEQGNPQKEMSPHAAAMAIRLGLYPEQHTLWARRILLPLIQGEIKKKYQPTPYFMYYIFEALKKLGYRREVLDCIRRWWGDYIDRSFTTTPETWFPPEARGEQSCCHAWSAHPLVHLSELILGVRQLEPAWRRVVFDPITWPGGYVSGIVPTPHGPICISWDRRDEREEYEIDAPKEITVISHAHEKKSAKRRNELCVKPLH